MAKRVPIVVRGTTKDCNHPVKKLGFVMVRHIQNETTSKYWYKSCQYIRQHYPNAPIVIIDDNSNPQFVHPQLEKTIPNLRIIPSEYPRCGEMLGYYYFWKNKWFDKAVVMHDSVFLKKWIDFERYRCVRFLWHFDTKVFDDVPTETEYLRKVDGPYLRTYENKDLWNGCFGVMSVIDHDFLRKIQSIFVLMDVVKTRPQRSCMERVFAVMCRHHYPELSKGWSIMGDIRAYPLGWGYSFHTLEAQEKTGMNFPALVKVWTGR